MSARRKPKPAARRAGIYVRISSDATREGLGVKRQERDCRMIAAAKGWTVAEVYTDNDTSAFNARKPRPGYERLLGDIKAGAIDAVIVYRQDRLHRRPVELEQFMVLAEETHLALASVSGDTDLLSPEGRLHARITGDFGAHESEVKRVRIRRKHLELAEAGKVAGGGQRPLGFEQDRLAVRHDEAELIREAAKRVLAGDSVYSVCRDWNDRGVRTPMGNTWRPLVLRKILCSARIAGQREYDGRTYPAVWPAIVTVATHARLRGLLCNPARRNGAGSRQRYVLSGIARCGTCEERLTAHRRMRTAGGVQKRVYDCSSGPGRPNCGKVSVVAEELEALVSAAVWHAIDGPKLAAAIARTRRGRDSEDGLIERIRADEDQLGELADMWAGKKIAASEWLRAREAIEARVAGARARLATQERSAAVAEFIGKPGQLEREWDTLTVERRRAVVRTVLDRVTVQPAARGANRFAADRVGLVWRF
ncbi:MAG: recombinase family protein [Chloroflexota bacterium]|nr:recombinase family protein [Chloroflexota bacterium]